MRPRHWFLTFIFYIHVVAIAAMYVGVSQPMFTLFLKCVGINTLIWFPLIAKLYWDEVKSDRKEQYKRDTPWLKHD